MATVRLTDPDYVESLVEQMRSVGMSDDEIAEALDEINAKMEGEQ